MKANLTVLKIFCAMYICMVSAAAEIHQTVSSDDSDLVDNYDLHPGRSPLSSSSSSENESDYSINPELLKVALDTSIVPSGRLCQTIPEEESLSEEEPLPEEKLIKEEIVREEKETKNAEEKETKEAKKEETKNAVKSEIKPTPAPRPRKVHNSIILDSPDVSDDDTEVDKRGRNVHFEDAPEKEQTNVDSLESLLKKRSLLSEHKNVLMFVGESEFPVIESKAPVKVLVFHNCKFTEIPEIIYTFTELYSLTFVGCAIKKLPEEMHRFPNLSKVQVTNCIDLKALPPLLFECPQLTDLSVTGCSLTSLPDHIGVAELIHLNVSNNKITALPDTISSLAKLVTLNASGNQLTYLPNNLPDLISLRTIDLSHNKIAFTKKDNRIFSAILEVIPKEYYLHSQGREKIIKESIPLPRLEVANLSHNKLEYIPCIFFVSDYIKNLDFSHNQIETVDRLADYLLRSQGFNYLDLRENPHLQEYGNMLDEIGFRELFWLFNRKVLLSNSTLDILSAPITKADAYDILTIRTLEDNLWNFSKVKRIRERSMVKFEKEKDPAHFQECALRYKINEYLLTIKQNVASSLFSFPVYSNSSNVLGLGRYWSYVMEDEIGPGNSKIWAWMGPPYPYEVKGLEDPFFQSIGNAILAFYTRFTVRVAADYIRNKINAEPTAVKAVIRYVHYNHAEHKYASLFTYNPEPMVYAEISTECAILLLKTFDYIS
ncbi:hypothetical protein NERG_01394 [Nematocida ausubeli]|uniref:Uncharacterized protein n=1 Tax=Nematocida ausubeli (strain ATCC PRA-371 / ERTm2) TaxID=1913371 RepID=H8ZCF1_NEMA1|nr:hypothetical protein NERG_01394 [Nematocida ausubeli]